MMTNRQTINQKKGFTLIELLIVIAIILILIAIALPNFLEAQIRARVTQARGDMRSISTAMEMYSLDFKTYPEENEATPNLSVSGEGKGLLWLTSPISYISSVPSDPFTAISNDAQASTIVTYETGGVEFGNRLSTGETCNHLNGTDRCLYNSLVTWAMWSKGPDADKIDGQELDAEDPHYGPGRYPVMNYSPTNGTKSKGSIYVWGGDPFFIGVAISDRSRLGLYKKNPGQLDVPLIVDGQPYLHQFPPTN